MSDLRHVAACVAAMMSLACSSKLGSVKKPFFMGTGEEAAPACKSQRSASNSGELAAQDGAKGAVLAWPQACHWHNLSAS